jgi:hypothetical protein
MCAATSLRALLPVDHVRSASGQVRKLKSLSWVSCHNREGKTEQAVCFLFLWRPAPAARCRLGFYTAHPGPHVWVPLRTPVLGAVCEGADPLPGNTSLKSEVRRGLVAQLHSGPANKVLASTGGTRLSCVRPRPSPAMANMMPNLQISQLLAEEQGPPFRWRDPPAGLDCDLCLGSCCGTLRLAFLLRSRSSARDPAGGIIWTLAHEAQKCALTSVANPSAFCRRDAGP